MKKQIPKIYCKINIDETDIPKIIFYGYYAFIMTNEFLSFKENREKEYITNISLDDIYHFLANNMFIPISDNFFYIDVNKKDILS